MGYPFKRNIYYNVLNAMKKTSIVFLLGPRRCGKTVALRQLEGYGEYYNFKSMSDEESMDLFERIRNAMQQDEDAVFLLDEITYAFFPDREINRLAEQLSISPCKNTKVVMTGSQSVALEFWARQAFCGDAGIVHTDFLSYGEWLKYKGITKSTEETYKQFLWTVDEFYGFLSLEEYLRGCLEETIISNSRASNVIIGNEADAVNVDALLDICYATLFTLRSHVSHRNFVKSDKLGDAVKYYFRQVCEELGDVGERISASFVHKYNDFRSRDKSTLEQSFQFLWRAGLITITPVASDVENIPDVKRMLFDGDIESKDELFRKFNACIKYPMFYVAIIKDILGEVELPQALLGSIVECHVRGILRESGAFEYRDAQGHEVDYVNVQDETAVEITVSNKRSEKLHFDYLPEGYRGIVLTKDVQGINRIPYHEFIANGEIEDMRSSVFN